MRHRPAPTPVPLPSGRRKTRRGDRGYILVSTGLVLVPLMLFTAFAVDVGGWYARGAKLQRAADAAALAGAARMPDFPAARTLAIATAKRNGVVDGGTIDIEVTQGANDRQLKVVIVDSDVTRYLSSLVLSNMTIRRSAVAEFVLPVPLGSPENYFGNDPTATPGPSYSPPGLWGNIHGPATDNMSGDRYAGGCRGTTACATKTAEYTGSYMYAIDVPAGGVNSMQVEIFDAGMYPRATEQTQTGDRDYDGNAATKMTTTWEMFGTDSTPLDAADNILNNRMFAPGPSVDRCETGSPAAGTPTPGRIVTTEGDAGGIYQQQWASICRRTVAEEGRYYLRVSTSGNGNAANRYSIRVKYTGANKPRLSAYQSMSMFNNNVGLEPQFYLAQVLPVHAGKAFIINLYDPGEIGVPNAEMQIERPNATGTGTVVAPKCKLSVYTNPTDTTPSSTQTLTPCSVATTTGTGAARFDGDLLKFEIVLGITDLGANYTCVTCWWKVRYELNGGSGSPADTTTWSAAIKGDPVHLINE